MGMRDLTIGVSSDQLEGLRPGERAAFEAFAEGVGNCGGAQFPKDWFQGRRFKSDLSGWQVLRVFLVGVLITVCTLGIGLPWAIKIYLETYTNSTRYTGELDLDALGGSHDAGASALLEGLGEAGEALESLGDFLGG